MYLSRGLGAASPTVSGLIASAASQYGVPVSLATAVAQKESGFNQAAVGSSGEIGVFQLMPGTAAQLGVNPSDLSQNVQGGVRYLSQLYAQYGDWNTALEAYNGGPGNVAKGTVSPAAQSYASSVLSMAGISDGSSGILSSGDGSGAGGTGLFDGPSGDSLDLSSIDSSVWPTSDVSTLVLLSLGLVAAVAAILASGR
jgi:Transglycosylase SLT domain